MNKILKLWHQIRIFTIRKKMDRVKYLQKKGYFKSVGERVMINFYKIPLYPNLISIGNNVWIASKVTFVTHDVLHYMLNGIDKNFKFTEKIGCIKIGDNVFIGNGSKIMYDVNIGNNVVIAAGSIVTKDVADGSVVAGIPAKKIGSFQDLYEKRKKNEEKIKGTVLSKHESGIILNEEAIFLWEEFYKNKLIDRN